jgi:hypothetical protein
VSPLSKSSSIVCVDPIKDTLPILLLATPKEVCLGFIVALFKSITYQRVFLKGSQIACQFFRGVLFDVSPRADGRN